MKLHFNHRNSGLSPLHHYQYTVIFLFISGFFLFFPFYLTIKKFNLDGHVWQWYFFFPWMAFYTIYCLIQRNKIKNDEMTTPLKHHLIHWILLGVSILIMQLQPNNLKNYYSIDWAFIIFSLFLSDGYWDFKKLSWRSLNK